MTIRDILHHGSLAIIEPVGAHKGKSLLDEVRAEEREMANWIYY
jgi:hypothetical protein